MSSLDLIGLIPFVPAAGALANRLIGARMSGRTGAAAIGCVTMALTFGFSLWLFAALLALPPGARVHLVELGSWIPPIPSETATGIEMFSIGWAVRFDRLTAVLALLASLTGFLFHIYAAVRLPHESAGRSARLHGWLDLLGSFILVVVVAGNVAVMCVGLAGVSLCSYAIARFSNERNDARLLSAHGWRRVGSGLRAAAGVAQIAGWIAYMFDKHVVDWLLNAIASAAERRRS